jgi:hypothetical protein
MSEPELARADLARRAAAFFVDLLVTAFVFGLLGPIGPLLAAAYVAFRDGLEIRPLVGRSLGKAALGLTVVAEGEDHCNARRSLARNWVLAVPCLLGAIPVLGWIACPILGLLVLVAESAFILVSPGGKRFGDELARTQVVNSTDVPSPRQPS